MDLNYHRFTSILGTLICILFLNCCKISKKDSTDFKNGDSFWGGFPKPDTVASFLVSRISEIDHKYFLTDLEKDTLNHLRFKKEKSLELYRYKLMNYGIEFWNQYPKDKRRFIWLITMTDYIPHFYHNLDSGVIASIRQDYTVLLDTSELNIWKVRYQKFRDEFFNSSEVTKDEKQLLTYREIINNLNDNLWIENRRTNNFNLSAWAKKVSAYADYFYSSASFREQCKVNPFYSYSNPVSENLIKMPLARASSFGFDYVGLDTFLNILSSSKVPEVKRDAANGISLVRMNASSFPFKFMDINGRKIDIRSWRDKIILIDFWDSYCSSCIRLMPGFKAVYNKYKSRGFRVVSVSIDDKFRERRAIKIYHKIGADWPLVILGDTSKVNALMNTYGFRGVPQLLLFGRDGKLIMYNDLLETSNGLEQIINRLLISR